MRTYNICKLGIILLYTAIFLTTGVLSASAGIKTRIVVLPFYVEQGHEASTGKSEIGEHYRRMIRFIKNQLVQHDFEVIDPFAADLSEKEFNRIMERTREDSALGIKDMAQRFAVDAVYIVWLEVKAKKTPDGYWKVRAMLEGEGYDSAGRSLGANVSKTFKLTKRNFDEAVIIAEKEVGYEVGKTLTDWNKR